MQFAEKKDLALEKIRKFHPISEIETKNLQKFVDLILSENQNFNFIGKSTIQDIWHRHILDSAQILQFTPSENNKNKKFADFGSGAGFPGVVLSILGIKDMALIEKSFRKSQFLHKTKEISPNNIYVHGSKLEEMPNIKFDCITSRALAPLDKLLNYSKKFLNEDGYCLFLKGKNLPNEIKKAEENFKFTYEIHPSLTSPEGSIIKITEIR